jgi:hypothetical protein
MPSPPLPQRIPEDLRVSGPFPPLPVDVVAAVTTSLRAWALGASSTSSRGRVADSPAADTRGR